MRELDRNPSDIPPLRCAVIGAGRLGHALAAELTSAGLAVEGPLGRGADPQADVVLLTVPDAEIEAAAAVLTPGGPASSAIARARRRSRRWPGAKRSACIR